MPTSPPASELDPIVGDGMLLIGDAAGLAYPESGEGIAPAIESGVLAARTLIEARGSYLIASLEGYSQALLRQHPPVSESALQSTAAYAAAARALLRSRTFTRRVLLDRWFLRRDRSTPPLSPTATASPDRPLLHHPPLPAPCAPGCIVPRLSNASRLESEVMTARFGLRLALAAAIAASLFPAAGGAQKTAEFPPQLDAYFTKYAKLTPALRADIMKGQPVTAVLDSDQEHEVTIFGAAWIAAPLDRYLEEALDIEEFERGDNFRITKLISSPPRAEDFAGDGSAEGRCRRPEVVPGGKLRHQD